MGKLKGHASRSLEDNNAETSVENVSAGNNISNWARDYLCDVLAKNVSAFCPCPKNLLETKLNCLLQISLAEEISTQTNMNSVMWCLVVTLIWVYNEKSKQGKKK